MDKWIEQQRALFGIIAVVPIKEDDVSGFWRESGKATQTGGTIAAFGFVVDFGSVGLCDLGRAIVTAVVYDDDAIHPIARDIVEDFADALGFVEYGDDGDGVGGSAAKRRRWHKSKLLGG